MLTESFIASTSIAGGRSTTSASQNAARDAGVVVHELQPLRRVASAIKKSYASPNCLAYTATHVFVAQTDKAVVNFYNRERGSYEGLAPFTEKVTSIARIGHEDGACVLALGTEAGRVRLWEVNTGRNIASSASHLGAVNCLAVDATHNFLLSGDAQSSVQVWSISRLLSFTGQQSFLSSDHGSQLSPIHTLSKHKLAVTSIITGHSHTAADLAVSASEDKTCIVWDYRNGQDLHVFLLDDTPLCMAIDPLDQSFYIGLSDGSVQAALFNERRQVRHPIFDASTSGISGPTQLTASTRWNNIRSEASKAVSIAVNYDGTLLLTGHEDGKILSWDVGDQNHYSTAIAELAGPVTNIQMIPLNGFTKSKSGSIRIQAVVKPQQAGNSLGRDDVGSVPPNHKFNAQFSSALRLPRFTSAGDGRVVDLLADFDEALAHSSLPIPLIEETLRGFSSPQALLAPQNGHVVDDGGELESLKAKVAELASKNERIASEAQQAQKQLKQRDAMDNEKRKAKARRRVRREKLEEDRRKKYMTGEIGSEELEVAIKDTDMEDQKLSSDSEELNVFT